MKKTTYEGHTLGHIYLESEENGLQRRFLKCMNKTNKTVHLHNDTTFIFALFVIYLQLIRFNVSTAVSVILPPGLPDKNNVFRKHHIIFNHFDSKIIKLNPYTLIKTQVKTNTV